MTNPENWSRRKEIFALALDQPATARAAFVREACSGDAELCANILRLLDQDEATLTSPALMISLTGPVAGEHIAHYRIEKLVGRGGMGAVYKAFDTQLHRTVALKLIAAEYSADPVFRQRFLREARAASALQHPNVVVVHHIGCEGPLDFIEMEYVEGEPLSKTMGGTPLPLETVLDYSIQLAAALLAIHQAGFVHRDLKPANVILTPEGKLKVLDFGLAAALPGNSTAGESLTASGLIVGTPAYTSPEQAQGKSVTRASDVFSFAAVVYEMIAGRRAFSGESPAALLGAIIHAEPEPLRDVPAELSDLLRRCLHKDPALRPQNVADIRVILERLQRQPLVARSKSVARRRKLVAIAAMSTVTAIAALLIRDWRSRTPMSFSLVPLTTLPGQEYSPSFSPDGTQIAFSWDGGGTSRNIFVKVVTSETAPLRITTTSGHDSHPAWSPDGRYIAFLRTIGGRTTVRLTSPLGGPDRELGKAEWQSRLLSLTYQMSWCRDARTLAVSPDPFQARARITLIRTDTGDTRALRAEEPGDGSEYSPAFSPDGRRVALAWCRTSPSSCEVQVLETGEDCVARPGRPFVTQIRGVVRGIAWIPDGRFIVASLSQAGGLRTLWRSPGSGGGEAVRLDVAGYEAIEPAASSASGRIAFARETRDTDIWRVGIDGRATVAIASTLFDSNPEFAPDGSKVAFESSRDGAPEIWVSDPDGNNAVRLTKGPGVTQGTPRWSPDARWLAFDSRDRDGGVHIWTMPATGGAPRQLTKGVASESVPSWSRDSKWVYFRSNQSGRDEIWKVPFPGGGDSVQVTRHGGYVAEEGADGATLFYLKSGDGGGPVYSSALPDGPEELRIPNVVGRGFRVVKQGIYFLSSDSNSRRNRLAFYSFADASTRTLADVDGPLGAGLSVAPDGKAFLFTRLKPGDSDLMLLQP